MYGQFELTFPTVPVTVTKNALLFKGCSDCKVPIIRTSKGTTFGSYESKPNNCEYDAALTLCRRFYDTTVYDKVNDGFAGYDSQGEKFFNVRKKEGSKVGKQVYGYFYEGQYEAEQPPYNIQVDNSRLYLQWYKDKPIEFEFKDEGSINFSKYFEQKRDVGVPVKDRPVWDLLVSCAKVSMKADNKGYELQDKKGRILATCSPKKW